MPDVRILRGIPSELIEEADGESGSNATLQPTSDRVKTIEMFLCHSERSEESHFKDLCDDQILQLKPQNDNFHTV